MRNDTGHATLRTTIFSGHDTRVAWSPANDRYDNPLVRFSGAFVREHLCDVMGKRVLEMGCGAGENIASFVAAGAEAVIGVDPSQRLLAVAARRFETAPVDLIHHDIRRPIPLLRASADVTLIDLVLEYCADPAAPLAEAKRLTQPGGMVHAVEIHPFVALRDSVLGRSREDAEPTYPHLASDYLRAADDAGLTLVEFREIRLPPHEAEARPALADYCNMPVLLAMSFKAYR